MNKKNIFLISLILLMSILIVVQNAFAYVPEGTTKIFAVNSSKIALDANLSIRIIPGSGKIYSSIDNSLIGSSTQESEKTAVNVSNNITKLDIKNKYDFFFDIKSSASEVDGPSAGAAMTLLLISMLQDKDLSKEISLTGTIDEFGNVGEVGGVYEKAKKAADVGIKLFMVPTGNRKQLVTDEGNVKVVDFFSYAYENWNLKIVEVRNIQEVLDYASKDISAIDINLENEKKVPKFIPEKINYSTSLEPIRGLVNQYIIDCNSQLFTAEKVITDSPILDTAIMQNMLSVLNYAKDSIEDAEIYSNANFLYSAANSAFMAKIYSTAAYEISINPSILSEESTVFNNRISELDKKITVAEKRSQLCSLEMMEYCIGAKQRITWARNKVDILKSNQRTNQVAESAQMDRIMDYSYAYAWIEIADDFLDIGITDSKDKFIESNYFKEISNAYIIRIENKLVLSKPAVSNDEDILRRLAAAKYNLEKGWYVTSLYDAATVLGIIDSKENTSSKIDIEAFENKYKILVNNLKSPLEINKSEHIWSKLYLDHTIYYYYAYLHYKENNESSASSNLDTASSILNMASSIYTIENQVLDYYKNTDISKIRNDSQSILDTKDNNSSLPIAGNVGQKNNSSSSNQNVIVYSKEANLDSYLYILIGVLICLILVVIFQLERMHKNHMSAINYYKPIIKSQALPQAVILSKREAREKEKLAEEIKTLQKKYDLLDKQKKK
ncbi:MAG: S16 family serine protease [archaeon]